MPASLPSEPATELARRHRVGQIFSSPDQPPPPTLPLSAGTANLSDDRGEVASQSPDVLETRNSEIDRLGHPLAEIGNHHVRFASQRLDNGGPGKAAGTIGTIEQSKDSVLTGNVTDGGA